MYERNQMPVERLRHAFLVLAAATLSVPTPALSNGVGQNTPWVYDTAADKQVKLIVADAVARRKGGFYDGFDVNNSYNTYIYRQVNCSVSSSSTGNSGLTVADATTSSPVLNNASSTSSSTAANSASNALPGAGVNGLLLASAGELGAAGVLNNEQASSGVLNSGVSGSTSTSATGPVAAGGGQNSQVVNSEQKSEGVSNSVISGSIACDGVR